jgi:hypothetical protein
MEKITVKELVEFNRKSSDKAKKNFANKLKTRPAKQKKSDDKDGGGDYWVTSTSCIYNVIKKNDTKYYDEKMDELAVKYDGTQNTGTKAMYRRNIDILASFKDFNHTDLRPKKVLKFETVQKVHKILSVKSIPLYVTPSLLFVHERNGKTELGAVWLVAKLNGFKKAELGMFCELLFKFLTKNYADRYQISEDLCIAVDTYSVQKVTYTELLAGKFPFLIKKTVDEIRLYRK